MVKSLKMPDFPKRAAAARSSLPRLGRQMWRGNLCRNRLAGRRRRLRFKALYKRARKMKSAIEGKVVAITGASSGVGDVAANNLAASTAPQSLTLGAHAHSLRAQTLSPLAGRGKGEGLGVLA